MTFHLLPQKHVRPSESLLGIGAVVLKSLNDRPKYLDEVWSDVQKTEAIKIRLHGSVSLDTIVLAIDFLYIVGAVKLNKRGQLEHASN
ncbi:ABC-three component system middle component 6 [Allorhodopirellula solitaria]|uniref:Uncharacterized protein n=1 Tax=Allorhodopirellula solitaria TaxID=2527987 RepID=A0A5C5XTV5_9BACT|nr:ABC-three component system middle component 6 [Allorhodopirellula solitaria]TWT66657.1 hypothetical protein CA85_27540 [Allorhodopirellula solitaria]